MNSLRHKGVYVAPDKQRHTAQHDSFGNWILSGPSIRQGTLPGERIVDCIGRIGANALWLKEDGRLIRMVIPSITECQPIEQTPHAVWRSGIGLPAAVPMRKPLEEETGWTVDDLRDTGETVEQDEEN